MAIECLKLLRNFGQFDSVNAGGVLPFSRLALIYAENGRGKTTLASMFRSVGTGNSTLVTERQRLGSTNPPHLIINITGKGAPIQFLGGAWTSQLPEVVVFDDAFVAENVCSGIEIGSTHRQALHELILGAQGVALNRALNGHAARIEQHNQALRAKESAIPPAARGALTVDAFCALKNSPTIADDIIAAERALSAAQAAAPIHQRAAFAPLTLPDFDQEGISALLARTLPDLQADAAAKVRDHIRRLGRGGEGWIADGMSRIPLVSEGAEKEVCPFCAQDLAGSSLIRHYEAYFSQAYKAHKDLINQAGQGIQASHGGEIPAAFERAVRVAVENREFWRQFTDIDDIVVDTAAIVRAWVAARDAVLAILRAKAGAPLDAMALSPETITAIHDYRVLRAQITALSARLEATAPTIQLVKEQAATGNVSTLASDLAKLKAIQQRHDPSIAPLCDAYLAEVAAKKATEALRKTARADLDTYRQAIFPTYQTAINGYLRRFNAGFRLDGVGSVNNRSGSSATYSVLINSVPVSLTAENGPSFRNTLSAGDRNTLALAFFFASLEHGGNLGQKIVVIDDPMTSLDEHRSLATVHEMMRLATQVDQMIILSHSKPFLCAVWENAAKTVARSSMMITRAASGSTLTAWNVAADALSLHDHRHAMLNDYLKASDPAKERQVAIALRPILETFIRVAYPDHFPPGSMLGAFHILCSKRLAQTALPHLLNVADTTELRALLDYANNFHHDTNPAWETVGINDSELVDFVTRTLAFTRRM